MKFARIIFLLATFVCANVFAAGAIEIKSVKRKGGVDFDRDIYPFLKANCIPCHNKTTTKGELNLETVESMLKGGESGKAVIAGKGEKSPLLRAAAHLEDPVMPPRDNKVRAVDLTPEQLGLLRQWIDEGAKPSVKKERAIAWQPLADSVSAIYAAALSRDGQYAACSRGNRTFVYHIPTRRLAGELTDDSLAGKRAPRSAHRDLVPALAFSPDGTLLASGSYREIKIWKREEAAVQLRGDFMKGSAREAHAAETGQQFISGNDGIAILWDAEKKDKVREFKHGAEIVAVAASADGKRLATSGVDKTVKLWDGASGTLIAELKGERAANDGSAAAARKAEFLLAETNFRKNELKQAEGELTKLQERVKKVTEDLKTANENVPKKEKAREEAAKVKDDAEKAVPAEPGADDAAKKKKKEAEDKLTDAKKKLTAAEMEVMRAKEAVEHQQLELKLVNDGIEKQGKAIADSKAAVTVAEQVQKSGDDDAKALAAKAAASQSVAPAIAFLPDGVALAATLEDGSARLWSAIDGASLQTVEKGGGYRKGFWRLQKTLGGSGSPINDRVNALSFSPDGKWLLAGSGEFSRSGEITAWNVENGELAKSVPDLHKDTVLSLSFNADGSLLATGSADRAIKVVDTKTWTALKSIEGHVGHVLGVSWRADGRTLASAGADRSVKIWDYASGDRKKSIEGWEAEVTSVQYVGLTGAFIASCGDKRVRLMNDGGGEVRSFPECADFMQAAAASDDGKIFIGGGQDSVLRVWDSAGKVLAKFPAK